MITNITIGPDKVNEALKRMSSDKAVGLDNTTIAVWKSL